MTAPKKQAPSATVRSGAQDSTNDADIIATLVDAIKARIMAGEMVAATDYPESDRPLFWSAIAIVRDDLPCVRPIWRTIASSTLMACALGRSCSRFSRARKDWLMRRLPACSHWPRRAPCCWLEGCWHEARRLHRD